MIELTEEEFNTIYKLLETITGAFPEEDIVEIVLMERHAWKMVQDIANRSRGKDVPYGQSTVDPPE